MRIKKARNGQASQPQPPKKKNPYLIDQYGDTLRVGTKSYAAEEKRRGQMTKSLTEAKKASMPATPKKKMKTGGKLTTAKGGKQMLKRADGSVSQRGLWDNLRSAAKKNKAAGKPGKKPTAAMLKQEKKIKAKSK
jgi:hypothetical protein